MGWPVVCVRSVSRPRRARKQTASKNSRLITKAGCHLAGVGRCDGRPERIFALPWSSDVFLGAVDLVLVDDENVTTFTNPLYIFIKAFTV